jgi:hypothetical protein
MSHLELEELPDDHGTTTPGGPSGRRPAGAGHRVWPWLIGALALLALLAGLVRYALPALGEPASRGAVAVVEHALSAAISKTEAKAEALWDGARRAVRAALKTQAQRKALEDTQQRRADAREAERREAAWQRFFQRSAKCMVEENQTRVDCVNEFMRAKREFDRRWAAGEL